MSKNIVVCCDGTGNEFTAITNSNVIKLYSTLIQDDRQIAYYHPGVGTMGSPNARARMAADFNRRRLHVPKTFVFGVQSCEVVPPCNICTTTLRPPSSGEFQSN
jgi:uncharacterized protein (DUF2235 family)